jgi:hypothetical protein
MHAPPFARVLATVALVAPAACNPFGPRGTPFGRTSAHEVRQTNGPGDARWAATLVGPATAGGPGTPMGSATMRAGSDDGNTYVAVELVRATPGAVHAWQLRRGPCGADAGAFGSADAYRALAVDDRGRAAGSATVPVATPTAGQYHVTVGASAARPGAATACGDFALVRR